MGGIRDRVGGVSPVAAIARNRVLLLLARMMLGGLRMLLLLLMWVIKWRYVVLQNRG